MISIITLDQSHAPPASYSTRGIRKELINLYQHSRFNPNALDEVSRAANSVLTKGDMSASISAMQPVEYEQSVFSILKRDKRFDAQAYVFLKEALDFTLKRVADANGGRVRHVSGPELLDGFRDLALEQFGPMASTLMTEWGVRKCQDVGDMVFLLIEEQVFGKQESDSREDFSGTFDLEESLIRPFLPRGGKSVPQSRNGRAVRSGF